VASDANKNMSDDALVHHCEDTLANQQQISGFTVWLLLHNNSIASTSHNPNVTPFCPSSSSSSSLPIYLKEASGNQQQISRFIPGSLVAETAKPRTNN